MTTRRTALRALAAAWLPGLAGCGRKPVQGRPVAPGATVLALGDSLTHGTGAPRESSYPAVLARLSGWAVVNAGVPGDTAAQALARWPELRQAHQPALVLLCIGGNDLLRRSDETALRDTLRRLCTDITAGGAQCLLLAVPRPTLASRFTGSLNDHALYAEVAESLRLPLHARGWSDVLADERLRSDEVHANAEGYAKFAQGLLLTLRSSGLLLA